MKTPPEWEIYTKDIRRMKVAGGWLYCRFEYEHYYGWCPVKNLVFVPTQPHLLKPKSKPKYDESGFAEWLRAQGERQDEVGQLSRDSKAESGFPKQATCRQVVDHLRRTNSLDALGRADTAITEFRWLLNTTPGMAVRR